MKKIISSTVILTMVFLSSIVVSAEGAKYDNIFDLFQYWSENGAPQWVSGVSSTDGSPDHLTVTLLEGYEDQEETLRAMLRNDSALTVVTGGAYSEAEMLRVQEEIVAQYMGQEGKVAGCGVGWTTINGVVTGFGESGTESRVVVDVLDEYYGELKTELVEKYGDMVHIEATSGYATVEDSTSNIIGGAEGPTSIFISDTGSTVWMLMFGGVIIVAIIFAVIISLKRIKKTRSGK